MSPASSSSQIAPMPVGLDSSVETKLSGTPPAVSTSCSSVPSQNVLPRERPRSHSPAALRRPVEKENARGRKHRKPGMIYVLVMSCL